MKDIEEHYLTKLLSYLKTNPKSFAESIGYNRADKIYHILKFRNGVSTEVARDICNTFSEVNYDWLLTGEGEMLNADVPKAETNTNNESLVEYLKEKIAELERENKRLTDTNGYYRGLLDKSGIDYKQTGM